MVAQSDLAFWECKSSSPWALCGIRHEMNILINISRSQHSKNGRDLTLVVEEGD
jgi:hypothetical protein